MKGHPCLNINPGLPPFVGRLQNSLLPASYSLFPYANELGCLLSLASKGGRNGIQDGMPPGFPSAERLASALLTSDWNLHDFKSNLTSQATPLSPCIRCMRPALRRHRRLSPSRL